MVFGQLEKLLMKAVLEPDFRRELTSPGEAAAARFGCGGDEAKALAGLLANEGAGLNAVMSVIETAIDVRVCLGLWGKLPHDLAGEQPGQNRFAGPGDALNRHAG
jgi:hypothetical protein